MAKEGVDQKEGTKASGVRSARGEWRKLTGAPDSAQEGVDQEDAGPPVAPEGSEGKVVGPILGPQEQHTHNEGVHIDDQVVVQLMRPEVAASSKGPVSTACNTVADASVRAMNDDQNGMQHDGWFGRQSSERWRVCRTVAVLLPVWL